MANIWYITVCGEEFGPLTDNQLREMVAKQQLTPLDKIRKEPSPNWVPAAKVRGLFAEAASVPSTVSSAAAYSSADSSTAVVGAFPYSESDYPIETSARPVGLHLIECPDCGKRISPNASACPNCGHAFFRPSRSTAIALAWIFGGIGVHKFYLRRPGDGIAALLFCWTFIPALFALIEGFQYLLMDDVTFVRKFGSAPNPTTVRQINRSDSAAPTARRRWLIWAAVIFVVLAVAGMIGSALDPDHSRTGNSTGRIGSGSSLRRDTPAAITQEVYNRMSDLAAAGDDSGIERLMAAGLAFSIPEGTEVRVIDLGILTTEIKVESGPYSGKYFIVATSNINR